MIKGDPYVIMCFWNVILHISYYSTFNAIIFFFKGQVIYRSRYLQGDTYNANMAAKRIVVSEMGTMAYPDPNKNFIVK